MANRTTVKSNIVTKNVPTVTNAILGDILNADLADNVCFREDVAVAQSASASAISVDFTGKDRVDLTRTGGTLNITVTGIEDGETKFLLVTKTAGQAVTWVGVTDITPIKSNADALPLVLYEIVRKGSNYFVKAWVDTVSAEATAIRGLVAANKAELGGLQFKIFEIGDWNMDTQTFKSVILTDIDRTKIRDISILVRTDADVSTPVLLDFCGAKSSDYRPNGHWTLFLNLSITLTTITMDRRDAGIFDSVSYDSTSYNRGWIIVAYTA